MIAAWVLALFVVLAVPPGEQEDVPVFQLEELLPRLADGRASVRRDAQRSLTPHLVRMDVLSSITLCFETLPLEVRLRIRSAVRRTPACAGLLLILAKDGPLEARPVARAFLEDLLVSTVAKRRPVKRTDIVGEAVLKVFEEGAVTGLAWPVGPPLPLAMALDWMQEALPPGRPLVLDPCLPAPALLPVSALELLPEVDAALLRRILGRRELEVQDLGLVWLVRMESEVENSREDQPEEPLEPGLADGLELRAASILTELLLNGSDSPEEISSRAALFQALRLEGAAQAVSDEWSRLSGVGARWAALLSIGAGSQSPALYLELLSSATPPESRARQLRHLARHAPWARSILPDLLRSSDPASQRAGCFLAASSRDLAARPLLEECAGEGPQERRVAAALALAELFPEDAQVGEVLFQVLSEGVPPAAFRQALECASMLFCASSGALPLSPLLGAEDDLARAIGAGLLGVGHVPARIAGPFLATDHPLSLATYGLAVTSRTGVEAMSAPPLSELLSGLIGVEQAEGALAEILVRQVGRNLRGSAWLRAGKEAVRRRDPLLLGTLFSSVVSDLTRDEVYPGSVLLRSVLHPARERGKLLQCAYRELSTALSAPDAGKRVQLLEAARIPFAP
ncbi:MAG: hypothetical protein V2A76_17185 [Planctomycetota bacterium]